VKRVLLLMCQGTEVYEAAAFVDVLGWAGVYGSESVEVVTTSPATPVRCTFGLTVTPDVLLADVDPAAFDALAVPGGFEDFGFYTDAYSDDVQRLIRHFGDSGKPVASICVGALPLAKAGLLDGRRATTYHLTGDRRTRQLAEFGANVVDASIVQDGSVLTSTSPGTAVEVALRLLELLTGADDAAHIREIMGFAPSSEFGSASASS
jgi:4-methyl-5(b-hydroxyethyl)-thiazole monophosphate biosynthesis